MEALTNAVIKFIFRNNKQENLKKETMHRITF